MRHIQNAALFGLIGGIALMWMGMAGGGIFMQFAGMALGLLVGVPAAYFTFVMQDFRIERRGLRFKVVQPPSKTEAQDETIEEVPVVVRPKPTPAPQADSDSEPIEIPVRVVPPDPEPDLIPVQIFEEAAEAEAVPIKVLDPEPEPEPLPGISDAERQRLIDDITATTDLDLLATYATHEEPLVRLYAVQKLGDLRKRDASEALLAALEDDQDVVKRAAKLALHKLGMEVPKPTVEVEEKSEPSVRSSRLAE